MTQKRGPYLAIGATTESARAIIEALGPVSSDTPLAGQVPVWDGVYWTPGPGGGGGEAHLLNYVPSAPVMWSVPPDTAGDALDELASALSTFETASQNLRATDATFVFDVNDRLETVIYATGITKSLTYDVEGNLTSVTLVNSPSLTTQKLITYDPVTGNIVQTSYV